MVKVLNNDEAKLVIINVYIKNILDGIYNWKH